MEISIIIPFYNEEKSLEELQIILDSVLQSMHVTFEIIFVDDGSTDSSWSIIKSLVNKFPNIMGIRFGRNFGKSQALHAGFSSSQGNVVITMDSDLQDDPSEIPKLYEEILKGADLVSGWKKNRKDPILTKNIPSRLFNYIARKISGIPLHDFNCGLKAYKKEVIKSLDVYGNMHRYIPVLVKNLGFNDIRELPVKHHKRKYGNSKFGPERFFHGFLDLLTLQFISKFGRNPMHFFGFLGIFMFVLGLILAGYIGTSKLLAIIEKKTQILITDNPLFYISLTTMILGSQLFVGGFLGELIIKKQRKSKNYFIIEEI